MADRIEPASDRGHRQDEWTIELDLTCQLGDVTKHKLDYLRAISAQTKSCPVTIIAQAVEPADEKSPSSEFLLKRYLIRDGEMEQIASEKAGTFAKGLDDLITCGQNLSHGKHVALFVAPTDGDGGAGLSAYDGDMSLKAFDSTVRDALVRNEVDHIDVLDLNACELAQTSVLDRVSGWCDHLLASSTCEDSSTQPLTWLGELVDTASKQRPTSANDLADAIVRSAKPSKSEARTLAHFNLKDHYGSFHQAMNSFAKALDASYSDAATKPVVEKLIDNLGHPYSVGTPVVDLDRLLSAVETNVADSNHDLKNAAHRLKEEEEKLIASSVTLKPTMVDSGTELEHQSQLTVLLPETQDRDKIKIDRLNDIVRNLYAGEGTITELRQQVDQLPHVIAALQKEAPNNATIRSLIQPLATRVEAGVDQSKMTDQEVKDLCDQMNRISQSLVDMPPFKNYDFLIEPREKYLQRQADGELPDSPWSSLVHKLASVE